MLTVRFEKLGLVPGDLVLDAGAGFGRHAYEVARLGGRIVALDYADDEVRTTRATFGAMLEEGQIARDSYVGALRGDATRLPFPDDTFDRVITSEVLEHIQDDVSAIAELARVLRPGGVVLFAGEPSRNGDKLAAIPKGAALRVAPVWRRLMKAGPAVIGQDDGGEENHALEHLVDVHAFVPAELRGPAESAGFATVDVQGEELAANWFGWFNRAMESTANPDDIPWSWRRYAFRGYLLFQQLDRRLLEGRLPAGVFYNLMVVARKADPA